MPSTRSDFEPLRFDAPIGLRVRVVTVLVFVLLALIGFMPAILEGVSGRHAPIRLEWLGPTIALPIAGGAWLLAIVREYRLVGDELHVVRLGRVNRYPLAGLTQIEANREAMAHAWKKWGNDGLGAITGRFHSKRLGTFEAVVTDAEHAVVLRWPGRTLVISPDREAYFVEAARERAHLRG